MHVMSIFRLLVAAALVLLGACAPPDQPLRVGITPWPGYEYLHLAREKGFFEAEGVNVRLVEFGSLRDQRRAFHRAQIDGGALTLVESIQLRHESIVDLEVACVVDFSSGADVILARPDIADVPDLRGRRIGVEAGSLSHYMVARALELHGMSISDVKLVLVHQADMRSAYESGSVDAVVSYPPSSTAFERDGRAHPVFTSAEIPGEIADVVAFSKETVRKRPEDVAAVVRAFFRAVDYAQEHPEEATAIMSEREGIKPEEFLQVFALGIHLVSRDEQAAYLAEDGRLKPVVESITRVLRKLGRLDGRGVSAADASAAAASEAQQ